MKKSILTLLICLLSFFAFSQVPQGISYQGIAYNTSGVIVTTPVSLRITILDWSGTGNPVYSEAHTNVSPDNHGVFNLNIGMGTALPPFNTPTKNFPNIRWGVNTKFLKVEIDVASGIGTNYVLVGTSQLMSVPYALYSQNTNVNTSIFNLLTINDLKYFDKFKLENNVPEPGPYDNITVFVQGYNSPGDGGGGTFIFKRYTEMGVQRPPTVDAKRPVSDGGTFIDSYNVTYAQNGIWMRIFSGDIDVRYYGCFGTGGTSINHALMIQKAIDYAAKSTQDNSTRPYGYNYSNTVYLPNGVYYVGTLILKSGVRIKGASKANTIIASKPDGSTSLFTKDPGVLRDINVSNLTIYGNSSTDTNGAIHKACFYFNSENSDGGGIWESSFNNLLIQQFTGDSFYFSAGRVGGYSSTNQFITMNDVAVESVGELKKINPSFNNQYHALVLRGSNGQFLFNNCRFDGGSYLFGNGLSNPDYRVNGNPVLITAIPNPPNPTLPYGSVVVTFNTCTIQNGEKGIVIDGCSCININTCWFEFFENAIFVKGSLTASKAISISNSNFLDAAGKYGEVTPNQGRVIIAQNAKIKVDNNFVINSNIDNTQNPNDPLNETSRFISYDSSGAPENTTNGSRNIGIASTNNYFTEKKLGYTWGLKKDIDLDSAVNLVNNTVNIEGAKTVYLRTATGNTRNVKELNSSLSAGELIVIRADQGGNIIFDETRNIYLGQMQDPLVLTTPRPRQLTLNNGGVATFVKIDEYINKGGIDYFETYVLISYKERE